MKESKDVINQRGLDAQELEVERQLAIFRQRQYEYIWPDSPAVLEQREWFQDQKFGLMVHWGLYNQIGIKESWPLVDNSWTKWQFKPGTPNIEVKKMYSQLHKGFLPMRFDPEEWAQIAYDTGFRYLCFTAKHHDGFCMWDTQTTDYKVTGSEVPWRDQKYADITKHLFNAFREKGMGISLYYSRADFSCPYYWEEGYAMRDGTSRVPSYDPELKPEKWKQFQNFVYAQLKELVTEYGKIDCLWYDGGCDGVQLGLPEMTKKLREFQPHMIGVIRGPCGECVDVLTPELVFPREYMAVPWEVCTVMGKPLMEYGTDKHISFGYTYDQDYMTAREVAHMLLDVVSKGGNLALNIAPQPDGRLPGRALRELSVLSEWMKDFSSAIYGTRAVAPYRVGKYAFTGSKDQKIINAFYLYDDAEKVPVQYQIPVMSDVQSVTDLRSGCKLDFVNSANMVTVFLPKELQKRPDSIADCFRLEIKQ